MGTQSKAFTHHYLMLGDYLLLSTSIFGLVPLSPSITQLPILGSANPIHLITTIEGCC